MNTIQDGIMIVDESGTIVSVNTGLGKITQYKKDERIGKPGSRTAEILGIYRVRVWNRIKRWGITVQKKSIANLWH